MEGEVDPVFGGTEEGEGNGRLRPEGLLHEPFGMVVLSISKIEGGDDAILISLVDVEILDHEGVLAQCELLFLDDVFPVGKIEIERISRRKPVGILDLEVEACTGGVDLHVRMASRLVLIWDSHADSRVGIHFHVTDVFVVDVLHGLDVECKVAGLFRSLEMEDDLLQCGAGFEHVAGIFHAVEREGLDFVGIGIGEEDVEIEPLPGFDIVFHFVVRFDGIVHQRREILVAACGIGRKGHIGFRRIGRILKIAMDGHSEELRYVAVSWIRIWLGRGR